jgi:hypothetical protein
MAKIKQLPKKLFVKIEHDPNGDTSYFSADAELYALVEKGDKIKIGTYQLVETMFAETVVKTSGPFKK